MARFFKIYSLLFIIVSGSLSAQKATGSYASSSLLADGRWYRIAIVRDGIYRIDYSRLRDLGLQDPSDPRIFANNQGQLSFYNSDPSPDDLKEVAIFLEKGSDGIFNTGDYILFYAQGTSRWKFNPAASVFEHVRHNYSDTAFYFLTSGKGTGSRIINSASPTAPATYSSSESDALYVHEIDNENLIKSGREWYQPVPLSAGISVNPGFSGIITTERIRYRMRVLARSPLLSVFRLYEGTTQLKSLQVQNVNLFNYTGTYAQITDSSGYFYAQSASPSFDVKFFNNGETGARGWLDFLRLQGRKYSIYSGEPVLIFDSRSVAPGRITEFSIKSTGYSPLVWDVTDPSRPRNITYSRSGDNITFRAETDSLRKFILFSGSGQQVPADISGPVPNQDLHAGEPADMIIVTHPLFLKYASMIAALHYSESGLVSEVVTPQQIYNEFSGGTADIAAIRNFVRMKYLRQQGTERPLRYLLLFGDGSYENRTTPPKNPCFIPTYQSQNSNVVVSSFTSDDFFGLLEEGEGEAEGTEDIGVGRLPVSDTAQAGIIVRKIRDYMKPSNTGDWKNVICIAADDEDGNAHMSDAEGLAALLSDSVPEFNIDKIYLDAFRQVTTANGQSYPDVNKAIGERINSGCLIFNYVGHGSETGLAHERVMKTDEIKAWTNGSKLPLFITATCEFSRFDDAEINIITKEIIGKTSAGEMVLLNPNGGAVALMSTTRVVYSAPNYFLNRNIFDAAFDRDPAGLPLRLGDIIRIAKNNSGSGPNKRNFSLLGDPALMLSWPWHGRVVTDSINHLPAEAPADTLKALSRITVSGHVEDYTGMPVSDFSGIIMPRVYEKSSEVRTLANDGGLPMKFGLVSNLIFSGKTLAKNGRFSFTFIVPRDIDYKYGNGRISYYASDSSSDMTGHFSEVVVGGFAEITTVDTTGPGIRLFMNDTLFRNGGITDASPRMLAIIEDEGGINTTGSGIGHDLTAWLDDSQASFVLNNYFENDFDNYMKGRVLYDLSGLSEGSHTLKMKAWDNFNNSSEETILFVVETGGKFILTNLINYPNPVISETRITAGHNRTETSLEITISIYDGAGRLVRLLRSSGYSTGYQLPPIIWDGNNGGGTRVGKGIYPYRITVETEKSEKASASGRIVIL
ncbi:MAG: type IX secretion system sortase PorU [Bacteroidales bacterium]|nr:type IX secretion system sortase PorU [Bacteroidales bacterium]